jgi:phosphoglycolate phosphatase-like HAD superfamily hydrolase
MLHHPAIAPGRKGPAREWKADVKDDAIIFDYDGTLIDTVGVKIASYARATIEEFGVDPALKSVITETQLKVGGAPKFVQLEETLRRLNLTATPEQKQSWGRRYVRYNDENTPRCPEFPVVRQMLGTLQTRFDLFLTSGLPDDLLHADAARRGLDGYFTGIQGGDKPAFCLAMRQRGYRHLLLIGDGKYDEIAAREADIPFVFVQSNADLSAVFQRITAADFDLTRLQRDCRKTP